jgi:hypothetical protein
VTPRLPTTLDRDIDTLLACSRLAHFARPAGRDFWRQRGCPPVSPDGGLAGTASPVAELSEIFTKLNYSLIGNSQVHN